MKVLLKNVRLSYPNLFEARSFGGDGDPAFSASFLFEPGSKAHKDVEAAIKQVAELKWERRAGATLEKIRAAGKLCLQPGERKGGDGYEGMMYVSARNKQRPLVLDRDKRPLTATDGRPYAGCYVNASVDIWAQDNQYGQRVNAALNGVQFLSDGEAFGAGAPPSAEDFDALEEEADDLV